MKQRFHALKDRHLPPSRTGDGLEAPSLIAPAPLDEPRSGTVDLMTVLVSPAQGHRGLRVHRPGLPAVHDVDDAKKGALRLPRLLRHPLPERQELRIECQAPGASVDQHEAAKGGRTARA